MKITVKSLEELIVDGENVGPVIPAIAAKGLDPAKVQVALYEWRDSFLTSKAEELQQKDHSASERIASEVATAEASFQSQLDAEKERAASEVAALQEQLSTKEEAQATLDSRLSAIEEKLKEP